MDALRDGVDGRLTGADRDRDREGEVGAAASGHRTALWYSPDGSSFTKADLSALRDWSATRGSIRLAKRRPAAGSDPVPRTAANNIAVGYE